MSRPTLSERVRGPGRGSSTARPAGALAAVLALGAAHCTFPEYDIDQGTAASAGMGAAGAGAGGTNGQGASSGSTVIPGGAPSEAGAGGGSGTGEGGAPECSGEQWPSLQCGSDCLERYPDHCYNGQLDPEETAVDCGFACQRCSHEQCSTADQCLSGECALVDDTSGFCVAPIKLSLTVHEMNASVSSTAWSAELFNDEPQAGRNFAIKDLEVRYYLTRNGITEPIVVRSTQANLRLADGQNLMADGAIWSVERFEATEGAAYDAYVAVRFDTPQRLFPGDSITLYQQMLTGDQGNSTFDQRGHYSFATGAKAESLHMTVYHQGRLLWGLEPRPANPRSCFARGVNLNGPPVDVEGHTFESAAQAAVTTSGSGISQGNDPYPEVSGGLDEMLGTATRLQAGQTLELPADNGEYLAYLYAVSQGNDAIPGVLTVQGSQPDDSGVFKAQAIDAGWAWARLGPYRVNVTDAMLSVGVTEGVIHFAGVELWYPE